MEQNNTQTTPEKFIVQCPSCQTKFAVSGRAVSLSTMPKFHCSRCDNVFATKPEDLKPFPVEPILQPQLSEIETDDNQKPLTELEAKPLTSTPFDMPNPFRAESPKKELNFATLGEKSSSSSLKIPKSLSADRSFSPPHEVRINPEDGQAEFSFDFSKPRSKASTFSSSPLSKPSALPEDFLDSRDDILSEPIAAHLIEKSAWRSVLTLSGSMVAGLAILGFVSMYLIRNPLSAQAVLLSLLPSAPQIPPSGLLIEQPEFSEVSLENGERLRIIRGKIKNQTPLSFNDIQVEGQVFDIQGKPLAKVVVDAANPLARTKIPSLSREMIQDLQETSKTRRFRLGAGESEDFVLALLDPEVSKAAFFSTRVYSVR